MLDMRETVLMVSHKLVRDRSSQPNLIDSVAGWEPPCTVE